MVDLSGIKNIVFDLGRVILDIDVSKTISGFTSMGFLNVSFEKIALSSYPFFKQYEIGTISNEEFRDELRKVASRKITDKEIDEIWNAMVIGFDPEKIKLLQRLKTECRTFLLSNTNALHEIAYNQILKDETGVENLSDLFEKVYYSHAIHLRKPDREIFEFLLNDAGLVPVETLFIDDLKIHTDSASSLGIIGYHLTEGDSILKMFR